MFPVSNSERMLITIMRTNNPLYLGLSLKTKDEEILEPTASCYKKIKISLDDFEMVIEKRLFKKRITYKNRNIIFFEESKNIWGTLKSVFVIDEDKNVWLHENLETERTVNKFTTVVFDRNTISMKFNSTLNK